MTRMDIARIQKALTQNGVAGWLFFDHHQRDPLAYRILHLTFEKQATRKWYYFIPANGEPQKLVHRIESEALDRLPGGKATYASWNDQIAKLQELLPAGQTIAMQYSPDCAIPYVSLVDAGTIDLIRSFGVAVVSSADLIQEFEARWTEQQLRTHIEAGKRVDQVRREAFNFIGHRLGSGLTITEYEVKQFIKERFNENGLVTDHGPNVAVNANASDPHYEPSADRSSAIRESDVVLIDMWAKLSDAGAVYYDITWTGFCGRVIPNEIEKVFDIVRDARKKACDFVTTRIANGTRIEGWEVDNEARNSIKEQGYGEFFFHRTGHSIGTEVHGTGANIDNLESHDERSLIPNTCFSIEPGIYLPKFGIRSEVNMHVGQHQAQVTGEEQEQLVRIE